MPPIATTQYGRVQGSEEDGLCVFRGVPFAAPPVGELRFRTPRPPESWDGVRDATEFGPTSLQDWAPGLEYLGAAPEPTSEDCLYLNVWSPALDAGKRPVMVWIHGGGFTIGSGSTPTYDGQHLARRGDVVIVTINYRLGALDFLADPVLSDDDEPTAGNYAIRDQIAALRWVRDHIAAFGGDRDNVTIFGESAGGVSVAVLLASSEAEGLFQRAIMQSGGAELLLERATEAAARPHFYEKLGLPTPDADTLRSIPAEQLLAAQAELALDEQAAAELGGGRSLFMPVIDGDCIDAEPLEAVRAGRGRDVDLLAGTIRDEFALLSFMFNLHELNEEAAHAMLAPQCGGLDGAAEKFNRYRQFRAQRAESTDALAVYNAVMTDWMFRISTRRLLDTHSADGDGSTYGYLFVQESPLADGSLGAPHGIDLPLAFGTADLMRDFVGSDPQVHQLSRFVVDAWLNFARGGNPSTPALPGWPQHRADRRYTMAFGPDVKTIVSDREEEAATWGDAPLLG